jgi:hypothetical protein
MIGLLCFALAVLALPFESKLRLQAENAVLRHQLKALEWLPKSDKYKEWKELRSHFGHYIPNGEPRPVSDGASIHESVLRRVEAVPHYRPINVPQKRRIIPMPVS